MNLQQTPPRGLPYGALATLIVTIGLAACGGGSDTTAETTEAQAKTALSSKRNATVGTSSVTAPAATALIAQPTNTEGRLLASNCFQCHGTLGLGGFDKIRGSEASEVLEFMTKPANRDIMAAHAQGYTPEQLKKIIAYLKQ